MCDCPEKYTKFPNWSCELIFFNECPCVLVPDSEINFVEDVDLPFIHFHHYENIISVLCTNSYYLSMVKHVINALI